MTSDGVGIQGIRDSGGKKPDAPTSPSATTGGNAQSVVSWTASNYKGKTGSVTYEIVSVPATTTVSNATSPYTFTGLTNGTAYTFRITAVSPTGVRSDAAVTGSITPVAPPYFPPFFPPFFPPYFPPYFPPFFPPYFPPYFPPFFPPYFPPFFPPFFPPYFPPFFPPFFPPYFPPSFK